MSYTTIVTGTTITSSWANTDVRDQVVTPFASTAARSSAITSPVTGMVSTLTANDTTEGLYQYNSAGSWRLPWNMPWGEVGYDELTTDQSIPTTTGAITGMSVTFTSVANRRYQVIVSMGVSTTVNSQTLQFDVYSNTASAQLFAMPAQILQTIDLQAYHFSKIIDSPAGGSTTWIVRGLASAANAIVEGGSAAATIQVIDVGPSGAPS